MRLSSHTLRIEMGRWSRTPRDLRLCQCGEIETEEHSLCMCDLNAHVRLKFDNVNYSDINAFFASDTSSVLNAIYDIRKF